MPIGLAIHLDITSGAVGLFAAGGIHKRHEEVTLTRAKIQGEFGFLTFNRKFDAPPALVIARVACAGLHLDIGLFSERFRNEIKGQRWIWFIIV